MRKSTSGFTIVELLIVVVIIGILAAIVVVAYNGITNQAKNTKTVSAVNAWVKALQLYKTENGDYPTQNSCFGKTTTYAPNSGYCWDGTGWDIDAGFLSALAPFMNNQPEPDITVIDSTYNQRSGAFHYNDTGAGVHRVYVQLAGASNCPSIGGLTYTSTWTGSNGISCRYVLP